ncbi:hypothetical protein IW140_000931 [Coemansia sp. RSA 1813]|nr:hypothetical protein EV178_001348 [Coemansia sp. RSA 1646]KAJ1772900.1 hypothetical protein LPJ74_001038 [Coemansia sp. RSA 1843]KAJ2093472.1 hypothetical protein IW138_000322 [Coemansia sp. RSA 986]KAJ2217281.1 hypothetical protein EV179_000748 [Coemansia sp. RSA 487]KAJ2572480.1 hypothetical protein IW140_000931 [Coemansia sp. RSA 1813]
MSNRTDAQRIGSRPDAVLRQHGHTATKLHNDTLQSTKDSSSKARNDMPYLQAQVVHYKPRVSVLDKELTTVSYHGLVNFLLLLLSATLLRMAIENYMKYGILVSIPGSSVSSQDWIATLAGTLAVIFSFLVAYAIERRAIPSKRKVQRSAASRSRGKAQAVGITAREQLTITMHIANLLFVLIVPSCLTYFAIFQPALGTVVMALACIMFLKLYSLAATNFDLRRAYRLGDARLDNDPLRFSRIKRWQFDVSAASCTNSAKDAWGHGLEKIGASDANDAAASTFANGDGGNDIGAEVPSVEELVKSMVPRTLRTSFSMNVRMLDDLHVDGNDRIDAKADALPRPRTRHRATTTAPNFLRRAATVSEPGYTPEPTVVEDGTQSDGGPAAETVVSGRGSDVGLSARDDSTRSDTNMPHVQFAQAAHKLSSGMAAEHTVNRRRIRYSVTYPDNVTLKNFAYFWLAPTLCYQPSYPRVPGPISKSFLAKRVTEFVIIIVAMYVVIQQYAVPTLVGSVRAIDTGNGFWLSERVLKLSVISATVWFLGFYAIFHAGLNALAEVLRFADRAFYLDWWNSVDLAAYWREWNLPIHYFCKRHIMLPLISAPLSLPVGVGVMVTFIISAIMHELLFGIPTHCLKGYSFIGMMMQIPLIQLTQLLVKWRGPESGLGNAVFWISFCIVGQPLGVVQYYYYWAKNNPQ